MKAMIVAAQIFSLLVFTQPVSAQVQIRPGVIEFSRADKLSNLQRIRMEAAEIAALQSQLEIRKQQVNETIAVTLTGAAILLVSMELASLHGAEASKKMFQWMGENAEQRLTGAAIAGAGTTLVGGVIAMITVGDAAFLEFKCQQRQAGFRVEIMRLEHDLAVPTTVDM